MAKKQTIKDSNDSKTDTSVIDKFNSLKLNFKDERVKFTLGLLTIAFAIYLTLAFTSFLFTWKTDYSKLDMEWSKLILNEDISVENWAGKTGASLANIFIHNWFGLPSFSIIFILLLIGSRLLNKPFYPIARSIKYTIIVTIWLSITFGYLFGKMSFFLGGAHGYFLSTWINASVGKAGTAFILLISLFAFIVFTFENALDTIKNFINNILYKIGITKTDPSTIEKEEDFQTDLKPATELLEEIILEREPKIKKDNKKTEIDLSFEINDTIEEEEILFEKEDTIEEDIEPEIRKPEIKELRGENEDDLVLTVEEGAGDIFDETDEESSHYSQLEDFDPTLDLSHYKFPPLDLLVDHKSNNSDVSDEELEKELISNKNKIVETLSNYKIQIDKIKATVGPTVTLYEIVPAPGVRISKIKNLEDDIALSLAALGIRIIAPIPGRGTIGIEVPNQNPEVVSMRSILASSKFKDTKYLLPIGLGKTISNETFVVDLAKMPHLLVAGATGQGKSVGLNAILTSLLYKKHPSQLKFVLIDPKKVELSIYAKIERHYLAKLPDEEEAIITDTQKVIYTLNSLCVEMDHRYDLLKKAHARNLLEYNSKFIKRKLNPENGHEFLPYIVIVIDEFADLIMTAGKEVETPIARIAQLARAVGIHLIIATQRPTTNIITGVIKANFPARIAFKVSSSIDSRTILDSPGANQLIGRGDMLISQGSDLVRVQCAFVDTPEIEDIVDYIGSQQAYPTALLLPEVDTDSDSGGALDVDLQKRDAMFEDAARLVVIHQQGSTSLIQRKFSIGYNRAGRIIDQLEAAGIVGPFEGSKARKVLYTDEYSLEQFLSNMETQESIIGRQ